MIDIEQGTFTSLVLWEEWNKNVEFPLTVKLAFKQRQRYEVVVSWLRTKLSFEILRAALLCVRGSCTAFRSASTREELDDFNLNFVEVDIAL